MSLADIWERFFWSVLVVIFVGLVWLKFLDSRIPCVWPGLIVALIVGGIFFYIGWRKATWAAETGETTEEGGS